MTEQEQKAWEELVWQARYRHDKGAIPGHPYDCAVLSADAALKEKDAQLCKAIAALKEYVPIGEWKNAEAALSSTGPCAHEEEAKEEGEQIDIVFDGPPSHESGRFVEVENSEGKSIKLGEWLQRSDGYWVLRFFRRLAKGR